MLSAQERSWSGNAEAQFDLGHRYPEMLEDTFSTGAAHISLSRLIGER